MILTTRYESNPKATARKGSEKIISLKIYVLKEATVDAMKKHLKKPLSSICRYFPKHQ